jgi:hypothetical protein
MIRWQAKGYDSGVADVAERSFKDQRRRRMAKVAGGRELRDAWTTTRAEVICLVALAQTDQAG